MSLPLKQVKPENLYQKIPDPSPEMKKLVTVTKFRTQKISYITRIQYHRHQSKFEVS